MNVQVHKSLLDIGPREFKDYVRDIPTLPLIYQEIFQMMQDPTVSIPDVAEVISRDQALASKTLQLVNSAFYGISGEVNTISRAVVVLGFQAVRSAALAVSVFDYFKDDEGSGEMDPRKFWEHSIAVATICKVLAERAKCGNTEEAFIVGLLHDTGKLIEKRYFPADFDELAHAAWEQQISWIDGERSLYEIDHARIGKIVFRAWDFPAGVVDAVANHHASLLESKHPQLTALVQTADFLAYEMDYGPPGTYPPARPPRKALRFLGMTLAEVEGLGDEIGPELESSMQILKLLD